MEHSEAQCQLLCLVAQAEGGPSGSQGSRHSPGPVLQSPAKKQKTAPLGATHIGDFLLSVCITIHAFISVYIYTSIFIHYYTHTYKSNVFDVYNLAFAHAG